MSGVDALILFVALVLGVLTPWITMRLLMPSLQAGHLVTNFRGRDVFYGLGTVWLIWAGSASAAGVLAPAMGGSAFLPLLTLLGPLALVAFALGLVDDAYGTGADRGFSGHIKAAARGRLTTGGLKVLGVSVASYAAALVVVDAAQWAPAGSPALFLLALPAGAAIALSANLVNLTDLRPGRALKTYSAISIVGLLLLTRGLGVPSDETSVSWIVEAVALTLFVAGPVVAVWRYDVGEMGMLGDAGANPAGAVAGTLVVIGLPVWGMLVYLGLVLALNLASERVSFSRVIEGNAFLHKLDMLGRVEASTIPASQTESGEHPRENPE